MLQFLILVGLAGVFFWAWKTRKPEIMQLLGKNKPGAPEPAAATDQSPTKLMGHSRPSTTSDNPLDEDAKKLSPLDVPMIQARYEKLGVWEHLSEHQSDMLRHTIMEHCKEGRVELWWAPLIEFARFLDYQKGEMPALIMDASTLEVVQVRKYLFAMDYRLRRSGLALEDITGADGKEFEPDHTLTDGAYKVIYKVRDRAFRFPVEVRDGRLDILGLVRTVNGLCERKKAKGRFVLLPPAQPVWCVVYALFITAEQLHRAQWAQLPLPAGLTDEDMEQAVEVVHSTVPQERGAKKNFELVPNVERYGAEADTPDDPEAPSGEE